MRKPWLMLTVFALITPTGSYAANPTCPTGFQYFGCNNSFIHPTELDCESCCQRDDTQSHSICASSCSTADWQDQCDVAADNAEDSCLDVCFVSYPPWTSSPTNGGASLTIQTRDGWIAIALADPAPRVKK